MKHLLSSAVAAFFAFSMPTWADSPVVVELFTSQGCSSCPPADEMLHALAQREDVIALALHVDYWDYIGWKDVFAKPEFTKRQRQYARHAGRRSVYTPQMVIDGQTDVVGNKPMKVAEAIAKHTSQPSLVDLALKRDGNRIMIEATSNGEKGPLVVQMVRYTPHSETRITRGENAGKTLSYVNIAKEWTVLKKWNGAEPLSITAPLNGSEPVVVIIQKNHFGPIVAAARLR